MRFLRCFILVLLLLFPLLNEGGRVFRYMGEIPPTHYESLPKLPNIDFEEGLRYMSEGDCMGGVIEEYNFTFWFCKPYSTKSKRGS